MKGMPDAKIRQQIAFLAAQMMYERVESEYYTAKRKAARRLKVDYRYRPKDLPSNREIRDQIQLFARIHEGSSRTDNLKQMRLAALRMMRKLTFFYPRLIGSVWTGHIRAGSDIDIHLFSDNISAVTDVLEANGYQCDVQQKRVLKQGQERLFTHIHLHDRFSFEFTLYATDKINYPFKSSITGKTIERACIRELEELLADEYPDEDLDAALEDFEDYLDRFELYRMLLAPLENVKQSSTYHPEGDALYHSLQVFELAKSACPYDEEFLIAALLHDIGKAIDPRDHVQSGLLALEDSITERTHFLIAHHMEAREYRHGTLTKRKRQRLQHSEYLEDVLLLSELDDQGRVPGAWVGTVDEALEYLQNLDAGKF